MWGRFFGIGIGPGDPELLTVKAVRLLAESDVIYVPKARTKAESLARKIVAGYVDSEEKFCEVEFTMGKTAKELKKLFGPRFSSLDDTRQWLEFYPNKKGAEPTNVSTPGLTPKE